jgi:PAS domain S-box-containing protein
VLDLKILHIDDSPGDRRLVLEYIEDFRTLNVTYKEASNLETGKALLSQESFDVVLLDLNLVHSLGVETLKNIDPVKTCTIVLSGNENQDLALECIENGAQDFIHKNELTPKVLEKTIRFALKRWQIYQQKEELKANLFFKEQQLDSINRTKNAYIVRTDPEGRYSFFNESFADTFLKEGENPIGSNSLHHIIPEDHEKTIKTVEKCFGNPGDIFTVNLRKPGREDGLIHNTSWEFMAVADAEGKVIEIQCTGYDITRQKEAIQNLKNTYVLSKLVIDHISDLMILFHQNLKVNLVSPSVFKIIGFTESEFKVLNFLDRIHPKDVAGVESAFKNVIVRDTTEVFRYRIRHALGHYIWLETRASSFFDQKNKERLIVSNSNNINTTVQLQKELKHSQERYSSLFSLSPYAIVVTVMNSGLILEVNQALSRISGFSQKELRGKSINRLVTWKNQTDKVNYFNKLKQEGSVNNYQTEFNLHDGTSHRCILSATIATINRQECIVNIIQDIHEQLELEKIVTEQEERYKNLIDTADDIIFELNTDGEMTFVSKQVLNYGYTQKEFLSMPFKDYIHPEDLEYVQSILLESLQSKEGLKGQPYRVKKKDGKYVWNQTNGAARLDTKGNVIGVVGIARDVTKEIQRQKELDEADKEKSRLYFNLESQKFALDQHAIVSIADRQGKITYANQKFCDISGYRMEELLGQDHRIINSGYHDKKFFLNLWQTIASGKVWQGEVLNKAKDGSLYWVKTSIVPRKDEKGRILEYISMRTDITVRKNAEIELSEREARLRGLIDSVEEEIFAVDKNYRLLIANQTFRSNFKSFFGIDVKQGIDFSNLPELPAGVFDMWKQRYDLAFSGKIYKENDSYVSHLTGEDKHITVNVTPFNNANNEIVGAVVYNQDITALTKAQEEEKYQQELLARLVDITGGLIEVQSTQDLHQYVAKQVRTLFDAKDCLCASVSYDLDKQKYAEFSFDGPEEILERFPYLSKGYDASFNYDTIPQSILEIQEKGGLYKISDLVELSNNHFTEESRKQFSSLFPDTEIYTIAYKNENQLQGALFIGLKNASRSIEKSKFFIETIVSQVSTVLTSLKSEESLKLSKSQLSQAQELASLGYWEWDIVEDKVTWSDTMWQIYNIEPDVAAPSLKEQSAFYPEDKLESMYKWVELAINHQKPYNEKITIVTKNGLKYGRVVGIPETVNGQTIKLKGFVQDITDLEKAIQREQNQLKNIRLLANSATKLLNVSTRQSLYKTAVWSLKHLANSEAIILFNLYNEDASEYYMDFIHLPDKMKGEVKVESLYNKEVWTPTKTTFVNELKAKEFIYVEHPNFTSLDALIPDFKQRLLTTYSKYEFYVFGILSNENLFGSIDVIIPEKITSDQKDILLSLVSQISSSFGQLKSNERILKSETRLQLAIDSSKAGIYEFDFTNNKYFFDQKFAEMLGYVAEDLSAMPPEELMSLLHPEDQGIVKELLNRKEKTADKYYYQREIRIKHRDGYYVWVQNSGVVLEWGNDGPSKLLGVHIDQTERKLREEQLLLFESVITNANDAVLITNNIVDEPGPNILYANEAFERISGYKLSEIIGKTPRLLQGSDTSKENRALIRKALEDQKPVSVELINYTKNGEPYWVDVNISPVFNAKNEVTHYIAIERDITEQKEREVQLKEALTRLELATRTNKIGVWEYRPPTNELAWDDSMFQLYGVRKEDFTSHVDAWETTLHPDDKEKSVEALNRAINGESDFDINFRIVTRDGKVKYISALAQADYENGVAVRMVGLNWDITRQVEAQLEIERALEEREEILNSMSDGFFILDGEWTVTYWSKAASEILSMNKEDILGKNLWDIYADARDTLFFKQYEDAMRTGKIRHAVDYHTGTGKWLEATAYPKEDGLAIFFRDITLEYKQQEELKRIKQNREALINTTKDYIWSIDKDMNLISANDSFMERFKHLSGLHISEGNTLLPSQMQESYRNQWEQLYQRVLNGEEVKDILDQDQFDKDRVLAASLYPIYNKNQEIEGAACYLRDITDRFKYLKALETNNKHLQDIAWKQSHLVRAPLANILGIIDLFKSQNATEKLDEEYKELIEMLKISADRLDQIIHEITNETEKAKWNDFGVN